MFWIVPENSASPCAFRGTLAVFAIFDEPGVFWVASTALHTRVPITSVIGRIRPASNFAATVGGVSRRSTAACRMTPQRRNRTFAGDGAEFPGWTPAGGLI